LVVAAASGREEFSIFLLENGADPNAADVYGVTALHYAIRRCIAGIDSVSIVFRPYQEIPPNMSRLVKALLAHGAKPNAQVAKDFPPYSRSPYALQTSLVGVTPAKDNRTRQSSSQCGKASVVGYFEVWTTKLPSSDEEGWLRG